jgi:hypothetical protein
LALDKAGNNIAARMAIMAMTTSSSIRVKAFRCGQPDRPKILPDSHIFIPNSDHSYQLQLCSHPDRQFNKNTKTVLSTCRWFALFREKDETAPFLVGTFLL